MKKILLSAVALLTTFIAMAQMQPLPNDPAVRTGKLANGMTYYIRHNDLPAGRAEFYLATNVGAIQETPDQDGLAHFLEHMCFNGLKNLPGKQMLDYLQHIGAEFGRNINASTGVEHTQYMLNNMPVTREGILDTCLLVMHDYSHFVLNEPSEIDAERGVILEEKRTRNNASWRMFEKSAPYIYGESSKYAHCNIIGSEENLKTFKPESLVNFYTTWYQPDMQALIIVGDIDVDVVLAKVEKLFADIPAPAQPTVKVMPEVEIPENGKPVVGIITDAENTSTEVEFLWKLGEPMPKEVNGTIQGYVFNVLKRVIGRVMSERFNDIAAKADAPFLGAGAGLQNLCETSQVFFASVSCKDGQALEGEKALLVEIEKMKRFGFTDDEIDRVKEDMLKSLKNRVQGASTRKNPEFIQPIMNNFFNGTPYMDPETELQIAQMIFPQINSMVFSQLLPQLFAEDHLSIIYTGIDKEGQVHPTEAQLVEVYNAVKNSTDIKPNATEAINKDFMANHKVKAGKVKSQKAGMYGSTEWVLSNGLKVVVLPTEYKKDQVIISLEKDGGLNMVPTKDLASFDSSISSVFESNCGVAEFSNTTVGKMLSGKSVRMSPSIGQTTNGMYGSCTPEDIETAFQLLYLQWVCPRFDEQEWAVGINQIASMLPNLVNTPNYALNTHMYKSLFNSERRQMLSEEVLAAADLETYAKYYKLMFSDVAGATMYIVGNVNLDELKPLVEKYCASLPKAKKAYKLNKGNLVDFVQGAVADEFTTKMTTPKATVLQVYNAKTPFSVQRYVDLAAADFILSMIYTDTLREEEGGTYGASARLSLAYEPVEQAVFQVYFDTNIEQQAALRALAIKGLKELAQNGPSEEYLLRAIENAKKNIPESRISNSYWMNVLEHNAKLAGVTDYDAEYEKAVNNISAEGIKAVLKDVLASGNFVEVIMLPEL